MTHPPANPLAAFDLTGKTALVTGASRGLGRRFASTLAAAGADLVVTAREEKSLADVVREIESIGRRAVPLPLDVTSRASIEGLAARIRSGLVVDILVNNAGCNVRKRALDLTWDDWNRLLDTAWATKHAPRRRCSSMAACRRARREPWLPLTRPPRHGSPRIHRGAASERRAVRPRRLGAIAP